jgi:hypothetical protein
MIIEIKLIFYFRENKRGYISVKFIDDSTFTYSIETLDRFL